VPTAICPECDEDVFVDEDMERGDVVTCEECATELEVVSIDPPEVKIYDEEADYDDEYDDDDFDDDDDETDDDDLDEDDDLTYDEDENEDDRY
jgi:lysine biosynthesis protein LysW